MAENRRNILGLKFKGKVSLLPILQSPSSFPLLSRLTSAAINLTEKDLRGKGKKHAQQKQNNETQHPEKAERHTWTHKQRAGTNQNKHTQTEYLYTPKQHNV